MGTLQLLNYAPSAAELAGMWRNIAAYLKPGGSSVGTMENPDVVLAPRLQSGQYGKLDDVAPHCKAAVEELQ